MRNLENILPTIVERPMFIIVLADVFQTKIHLMKQRNPNDIVVSITLPVILGASPPGGLVLVVRVVVAVVVSTSVVGLGSVVDSGSTVVSHNPVMFEQMYKTAHANENEIGFANKMLSTYCVQNTCYP
uniref:Uncharacterized protein n=1 Tax=Magallana gigas TaxID=29159 RepID=K1PH72_MAGGI